MHRPVRDLSLDSDDSIDFEAATRGIARTGTLLEHATVCCMANEPCRGSRALKARNIERNRGAGKPKTAAIKAAGGNW
jgi:hypothetical protein